MQNASNWCDCHDGDGADLIPAGSPQTTKKDDHEDDPWHDHRADNTRPNTKSLMHELALLLKRSKYVRSITLTTIVNRWTSMIMSTLGQMVLEYSI